MDELEAQYEPASGPADLAIVIVSANDARWLDACLSSVFAHAGGLKLEVVVVDNESTDGTRELVESHFPLVHVISSRNGGFAYGNNRGLEQIDARYALLLNPDTEIVSGDLDELVGMLDARPQIGVAGVRQVSADGELWPTIRRFPSPARAFGEALFSEHWPLHPDWAGERVLDTGAGTGASTYAHEQECDWTSGSFMLVRREALLSAGLLDERFFLYSEEPDLCLRIKRAGWNVCHLPQLTIIHHAGKGGVKPRMVAQDAYSRKLYAHKHFSGARRSLFLTAVGLRHVIRATTSRGADGATRRTAARLALRTLTGRVEPPFGAPPLTALRTPSNVPSQTTDSENEQIDESRYAQAPLFG